VKAARVVGRRLPQRRQAEHRRILMWPVAQRADRRLDDFRRLEAFGKPLAEIDRAGLVGETRHRLEDRNAAVGEYRVDHRETSTPQQAYARPGS
jgi:hypothetical protein